MQIPVCIVYLNISYQDMANAEDVRQVKKLKYEHNRLNSFSKMRVDLAAQVYASFMVLSPYSRIGFR